jgi:hypothetical protein
MGKDLEGSYSVLIELLFRNLPHTTEENHDTRTEHIQNTNQGHEPVIAQVVNNMLPTAAARVRTLVRSCVGGWVTFSPSTQVSSANSRSADCSTFIIIYHLGLVG